MPEGRAEGATFLPVAEADAEEEPEVLEEPHATPGRGHQKEPECEVRRRSGG